MTHFLRSARFVLASVAVSLLFTTASCSKKEEAAPAPTTGAIEGTVTPANSLATVTATNAGGLTFLATPNAASGAFSIPSLVPGTYTLTFDPRTGYLTPSARTVEVKAGSTAPAGTVLVSPAPQGSITGVITPADAVARVEILSATGTPASVVPTATTGAFGFTGLALGTYTVHYVVASGYYAGQDQTVTLSATAPTAPLGTVAFQSNGTPRGTMTWTANGTTYTATSFTGNLSNTGPGYPNFLVEGTSTTGGAEERMTLQLNPTYFNGASPYPLGNNPFYIARYVRFANGLPTASYSTTTSGSTQTGIINLTTYGNGSAIGTFAFVAPSTSGAGASSISVTNGTFNLRF